jgi:hypothetical protein
MAQDSLEHKRARSGTDLALLILCAFLALIVALWGGEPASALASPQSPVTLGGEETLASLQRSIQTVPGADPGTAGGAWRGRIGIGLIVLGMLLVIGGLLWIMDREASASPEPPGGPGGRARP